MKGFHMDSRGMTLLELLVVVVLTCLFLLVAVPAFRDWLARQEAQRVTQELAQMARIARVMAASRGYPVGLCGSAAGEMCDGQWADGLLLYVDRNRNRYRDAGEEILRYAALAARKSRLAWGGFGANGTSALLVESVGTPFAGNGSFTYCSLDGDPAYRRQVIISRSGRVRLSRDMDGDGIHESGSGGTIQCPSG